MLNENCEREQLKVIIIFISRVTKSDSLFLLSPSLGSLFHVKMKILILFLNAFSPFNCYHNKRGEKKAMLRSVKSLKGKIVEVEDGAMISAMVGAFGR